MAERLGASGAHVIAVARTVGGLEELDDAITAAGGSATLVPLDLSEAHALPQLGSAIHGRWGRLDLWLHTAAHAAPLQPVEHIAEKEIATSVALNLVAFETLIGTLEPLLRQSEHPKALIAADDRAGQKFFGTYGATKAAQSALTQSWAVESARRITIAEVVPPPMATALRARFFPGENRGPLTRPDKAADDLMARLQEPIEPGQVINL